MKHLLIFITSLFWLTSSSQNTYVQSQWKLADSLHLQGKRIETLNIFEGLAKKLEQKNINNKVLPELAATYNQLGFRQQNYGYWDKSVVTFTKGILLLEHNNTLDSLKASLHLNAGKIYAKIKDNSAKSYYLHKAEQLALKNNIPIILLDIYQISNKYRKGLELAKQINSKQYQSYFYYLLANSENPRKTRQLYFDSARITLPKIPNALLQNFQYHASIAGFFTEDNQIDSALSHCRKAEEISFSLNDDEVNHHFNYCYSQAYLAKKDYKNAYDFKEKSDSIERLYQNPSNRFALKELEKQRITFEKQKEIIQLETSNRYQNIGLISLLLAFIGSILFLKRIQKLNRELAIANESKNRLFSIISHDLRSPLATLHTLTQFKQQTQHSIKDNLENILWELDNLLNWSTTQLKRIKSEPKNLDLNELISENIKLLHPQIQLKGISIRKNNNAEVGVYADYNMLNVCLRNILNNAVKYSPSNSEIQIIISKSEQTLIEIKNHFDSQIKEGTGLGLEICENFILLNKGTINMKKHDNQFSLLISLPNIIK